MSQDLIILFRSLRRLNKIDSGMFAFRGFLTTLIPVFQNNNILLMLSGIRYKGFYYLEFLELKYLINPGTQTPVYITAASGRKFFSRSLPEISIQ